MLKNAAAVELTVRVARSSVAALLDECDGERLALLELVLEELTEWKRELGEVERLQLAFLR